MIPNVDIYTLPLQFGNPTRVGRPSSGDNQRSFKANNTLGAGQNSSNVAM